MSKSEIAIWIKEFNPEDCTSQSQFYKYTTDDIDKNHIKNFFDMVLQNIGILTGHPFKDISDITIVSYEEVRKEYYEHFRSINPNLNILSMQK